MKNRFSLRIEEHDNKAKNAIQKIFEDYGFGLYEWGYEHDSKLYSKLKNQTDPTSIILRFRPDFVALREGVRSVLVEVKSSPKSESLYVSIQLTSFESAKAWGEHVMYAFIEIDTLDAGACWAIDIPEPKKIFVPKKKWWKHETKRISYEYPRAQIIPVDYDPAHQSGHPYILIPKDSDFIYDLSEFIENELIN
ncbi:MAG: hypothetical protein H0Z24_09165 [Thermosipho sp. (in: Bacteria)]|nr:hypothetical protein [Thermosipho sp. (in: thermotogales)]